MIVAPLPSVPFLLRRYGRIVMPLAVGVLFLLTACTPVERLQAVDGSIPVADLRMAPVSGVSIKPLMDGEVLGVDAAHIVLGETGVHNEPAMADQSVVWLVLDGRGTLTAKGQPFDVEGETIARAPQGWDWSIKAEPGKTLHLLRIRQQLTPKDLQELTLHPEFQQAPHVKRFQDCEPYSEAIKSPKTISRTLLPENYVPRMAMGTVETTGPDAVGEHKHPMLEQFFFGLRGNDITVTADSQSANLKQFTLLHIPLGSMHGAQVAAGKKMHYIWMDFFFNKEGQDWLQMHKTVDTK